MGNQAQRSDALRDELASLAGSAKSPFLPREPAFHSLSQNPATIADVAVILEDELVPSRKRVESTVEFAFEAMGWGHIVALSSGRSTLDSGLVEGDLRGFPSVLLDGRANAGTLGFERLIAHARQQLREDRAAVFLKAMEKLTPPAGTENFRSRPGSILIRLAPLDFSMHLYDRLGRLVDVGVYDYIIGIDASQPDLGDRSLYSYLGVKSPVLEQDGFACAADVQVTQLLADGEMTGLFWRHGHARIPTDRAYDSGAYYVRPRADLDPVRIDIIARRSALSTAARNASRLLHDTVPLTPPIDGEAARFFPSERAFVPRIVTDLVNAAPQHRMDSMFEKFYADREEF